MLRCLDSVRSIHLKGKFTKEDDFLNICKQSISQLQSHEVQNAYVLFYIGRLYFILTRFDEAGRYFYSSDRLCKHHSIILRAETVKFRAILKHQASKFEKALIYYKQSEILMEFHKLDLDLATLYMRIGHLYNAQREQDKALKYYTKCYEIRLQLFRSNHPDIGWILNALGLFYLTQTDFETSLELFEKVRAIREASQITCHPDLAMIYGILGEVYHLSGNYGQALVFAQMSLSIRSELYTSNLELAGSYETLGNVYFDLNDFVASDYNYRKCLKMRREILKNESDFRIKNVLSKLDNVAFRKNYSEMIVTEISPIFDED